MTEIRDPDAFRFLEGYDEIPGAIVSLSLILKATPAGKALPYYWYLIRANASGEAVGKISLRIGQGLQARYDGNIGYEVDEPFRGHHYAYEAAKLLFPLARSHGMNRLFISCALSNTPSIKTIERLGGVLLAISRPPKAYFAYSPDQEAMRIYRLILA